MSFLSELFNIRTSKSVSDFSNSLFENQETDVLDLPQKVKTNYFKFDFEREINTTNNLNYFLFDHEIQLSNEQISSSENRINQNRENFLRNSITPTFINLLREEDFEFSYKTRSEEILIEQFKINALATRNWLNELFIKYFSDEVILIGILRIIGRFNEQTIFPQGQTIALAAFSHESDEVKELGIRAFEKWCSYESLTILKKIKVETTWLQDYVNQVIIDLEEELCHY